MKSEQFAPHESISMAKLDVALVAGVTEQPITPVSAPFPATSPRPTQEQFPSSQPFCELPFFELRMTKEEGEK